MLLSNTFQIILNQAILYYQGESFSFIRSGRYRGDFFLLCERRISDPVTGGNLQQSFIVPVVFLPIT